ncbi:MAG: acyl carrier protein [Acidobacteria bacterium]|uniref:Acyl carrier protein n=1 Tax=Candidatus Polarisedimenticola svalbardensis TaxID=2886004 RepID=A0A8J7CM12_9BACT|nr:acyl carrier protein [Candidatus Polarisedimenticola svalbardensis]
MDPITTQVKTFIVDNFLFGQGGDKITDDASLMDNGIVDSTGVLELVAFLEETWSIAVEDEELIPENLDTLGNITRFIQKKSG